MKHRALLFALLACLTVGTAPRASAQDDGGIKTAGDALDVETCRSLVDALVPAIERYTRMKFRRKVPIFVEPRASWERRLKQTGFGGNAARTGLAFYDIIRNSVTIVPWTMGRYLGGNPLKKSRREWLGKLGPILIHELTHAIHYQNFYVPLRGARQATLKTGVNSIPEPQLDEGTVAFLLSEGFAELVSVRTARPEARDYVIRKPARQISGVGFFMQRYRPDNKRAYRVKMSEVGYQDGLDLLHQLTFGVGPLGVRGVLYRPPPRVLLFQPKLLAEVKLDDPPNPDSIFGFLAPELPEGSDVLLAVGPGANRFFKRAYVAPGGFRVKGCLIGYTAEADSETYGYSRYSFFVADPDDGGTWAKEQAESLKLLGGPKEKTAKLKIAGKTAKVLTVTSGRRPLRARRGRGAGRARAREQADEDARAALPASARGALPAQADAEPLRRGQAQGRRGVEGRRLGEFSNTA